MGRNEGEKSVLMRRWQRERLLGCAFLGILLGVLFAPGIRAADSTGFRIDLHPSLILLGKDKAMRVSFSLPDGVRTVRVQAVYGTIAPDSADAPGTWAGTYTPPEQFYPAHEYIVASVETDDGVRWSMTSFPLIGQGEVTVKTRPHAPAHVRIGSQTFGPVRANAVGKAIIPVQVPPGETRAIDDTGLHIDLKLPPLPETAAFSILGPVVSPAAHPPVPVLFLLFAPRDHDDEAVPTPQITAAKGRISQIDCREKFGHAVLCTADYHPPGDPALPSDEIELAPTVKGGEGRVFTIHFDPALAAPPADEDTAPSSASEAPSEEPEDAPLAPPDNTLRRPLFVSLSGGLSWNTARWLAGAGELEIGLYPIKRLPLWGWGLQAGAAFSNTEDKRRDGFRAQAVSLMVPLHVTTFVRLFAGKRLAWIPEAQIGTTFAANRLDATWPDGTAQPTRERRFLFDAGLRLTLEVRLRKGAFLGHVTGRWRPGHLDSISGPLSTLDVMIGYRLFLANF